MLAGALIGAAGPALLTWGLTPDPATRPAFAAMGLAVGAFWGAVLGGVASVPVLLVVGALRLARRARGPDLLPLVAAGVLAGCRPIRHAAEATSCPLRPPAGLRTFGPDQVAALAGTYELVLRGDNATAQGYGERGRLVLWVQDSVRRSRGEVGPVRPDAERLLGAAYERMPPDTSAEGRRLASRDPDRPGGVYARGRLRLGAYDILDGTGDDLTVTHATADGFRGRWVSDLGIGVLLDGHGGTLPNPAGVFCLRRVPRADPTRAP